MDKSKRYDTRDADENLPLDEQTIDDRRFVRRRPTRDDLIALLSYAAHEAGSALACYQDDRQPDRAGEMERRLGDLQSLLHEAAGHFPSPKRSPWANYSATCDNKNG